MTVPEICNKGYNEVGLQNRRTTSPRGIEDIVYTFTQRRMCWIARSGLRIRQNLVTLPAAAIRTSASLSPK